MSVPGQNGDGKSGQMRDLVQRFARNVLDHAGRDQLHSDLENWRNLAKESSELLEASTLIATELHRQTEAVTSFEDHMDSAGDDTVAGAEELLDAEKAQAKKLPWAAGGTGATVGAVVGIVGGPLGVAAGAFVGGSIGGFIGRIPKRLIDRECEVNRAILRSDGKSGNFGGNGNPITTAVAAAETPPRHFASLDRAGYGGPGRSPGHGRLPPGQSALHTSSEAAEVCRLKVACLESILEAMSVSTESNWILDSDRKTIDRTAQEELRQRTAQVIADRHLKGLERGWLQAFVRPFSRRSNAVLAAAAPRVPGPAAAAQQQDDWVSLDGAGNEDGDVGGAPDDVEGRIVAALKDLKASQIALGHEVVDQLGKLTTLEDGVDRNLEHARRLDRRTTRLNE